MARPGLSYKNIEDAIKKIIKNKEKITINNIKLYTGKGSPTTISKFLKNWRINNMQNKNKDKENIINNVKKKKKKRIIIMI